MKIDFYYPTDTYIVAVSGGVDSVVLLDILIKQYPQNSYVVAYVDHGIRTDTQEDYTIVKRYATNYATPFEYTKLHLGSNASEATARHHRYTYLNSLLTKYSAKAIITAHHQDDVLETMCINIIRGTGRKGLSSLQSTGQVIRPMLHISKQDIYTYAKTNKLDWNEDSTNKDTRYTRNAVRHKIIAHMSPQHRSQLFNQYVSIQKTNAIIDKEVDNLLKRGLHKQSPVVVRRWFVMLPHDIAKEVTYAILKHVGAQDIDFPTIERATVAIKTQRPGKRMQVNGVDILSTKRSVRFISRSKTDEKSV